MNRRNFLKTVLQAGAVAPLAVIAPLPKPKEIEIGAQWLDNTVIVGNVTMNGDQGYLRNCNIAGGVTINGDNSYLSQVSVIGARNAGFTICPKKI